MKFLLKILMNDFEQHVRQAFISGVTSTFTEMFSRNPGDVLGKNPQQRGGTNRDENSRNSEFSWDFSQNVYQVIYQHVHHNLTKKTSQEPGFLLNILVLVKILLNILV